MILKNFLNKKYKFHLLKLYIFILPKMGTTTISLRLQLHRETSYGFDNKNCSLNTMR